MRDTTEQAERIGMATEIHLSARDVSKSFGAVRVLHGVSFDVHRGEVLGILGPNGAGKTTLFNMISGDIRPSGGEIRLGDVPLKGEPPFRRCKMGIGRTYQIPRPYSGMTTFENLLVASTFGGGRSERDSYGFCAQVLEDCELTGKANLRAGGLTLLDRKRLELARALASDPQLLLLDEIAGGLTDDESRDLVALVRRIRDRGVTIVWIEHVLHALLAVADRLMVLNFGEKIAEGAPYAVIADPEVKRVYMGIEG
ncbi:ABC transporter ATP-binding protein [Paracoccus sp. 22332]|uniref:ABC transporter ATP-binding protein n=1 Tax=Paracoccus sp. 22332 TaxID=3453913 RepID=UPI003F874786